MQNEAKHQDAVSHRSYLVPIFLGGEIVEGKPTTTTTKKKKGKKERTISPTPNPPTYDTIRKSHN